MSALDDLTPREEQVAQIAARGFTVGTIARALHLSPRTVETHLGRVYGKLHVTCRDELIELLKGPA